MDRNVGAEVVDEAIPVEPGGTFFVQLDRGSVDIESHESNEVRVVVEARGVNVEQANFDLARSGRNVHLDVVLVTGSSG